MNMLCGFVQYISIGWFCWRC